MPRERMYKTDHFLGLNEAADGLRELKMGQASRIVNFDLTDGLNLAVRPGIQPLPGATLPGGKLLRLWSGGLFGSRSLGLFHRHRVGSRGSVLLTGASIQFFICHSLSSFS